MGCLVWCTGFILLCSPLYPGSSINANRQDKKAFEPKLVVRYIILLVISIGWLGAMTYLTLMRPVEIDNHQQTTTKISYQSLQMSNKGDDYYYVLAKRSNGGKRPIVSYTYWSGDNEYTTTSRFGAVADGNRLIPLSASALPWNQQELKKQDTRTGSAFAAVMKVRYKNTALNGLGLKAKRNAITYTLIRVPSSDMVTER